MGLLSTIGAASGRAFGLTRVGAAIRDAYFNLTTLLLPGNGTNGAQNNTFLDSSSNTFTITRNGGNPGMTQGTFSPFSAQLGAWSSYYSGVTDTNATYFAANSAYSFGTGDFTVEAWVNIPPISNTNGKMIVDSRPNATNGPYWLIGLTNTGRFEGTTMTTGGVQLISPNPIPTNQWVHLAYTRASGNLNIWVNGVSVASATGNTNNISSDTLWIGRNAYSGAAPDTFFAGYMSNLRIVKGVAVYTGTFTPPTSPLGKTQSAGTNIAAITGSQTSLLFNQSNRFVDNSDTNATPLTQNTWPTIQPFSPFAPTAEYSAATVGGSGYFDGGSDYLSSNIANNILPTTGDFTAEVWVYALSTSAGSVFALRGNSGAFAGLRVYVESNAVGILVSTTGSSFQINSGNQGNVRLNSWNHIAVVRNGGTFTLFVNGVSVFTSTAISSGTALMTGDYNYFGVLDFSGAGGLFQYYNGYMSSVRISNTARTITVPTAPYTSDGNTRLLLNFTNAGITDATAKNDLETVGNAQISTTQSKFGGSSISFPGSSYAVMPYTPQVNLGLGGDITVEFWGYWNSLTASPQAVVGQSSSSADGRTFIYTYSDGRIAIGINGTNEIVASAGTITTGSWIYIAIVRSGSTTTIYKNGSSVASNTTAVWASSTNPLYVGGAASITSSNMYIDDLRITRYARTITTPTTAFPLQ